MNRTKKIYGNCRVYHPDGSLMFLCVEKRINWYLNRNLAEIINENPLSIKLKFTPKGNGANINNYEYLLGEKQNVCVVCGTDNLSILTKHHIVPIEYRKFLPEEYKARNSHDIVVICRKHHDEYEIHHATKIKRNLEKELSIESADSVYRYQNKLIKANKYAKMLMDPDTTIKLPKAKIDYFLSIIQSSFGDLSIVEVAEIDALKNAKYEIEKVSYRVIEKIKEDPQKINEFIFMWRKNFVETMKPLYLPRGWDINFMTKNN